MAVTAKCDSGLRIGYWMERKIASREKGGLTQCYFFTNLKEGMIRSRDLELDILDRIARK